jgi:hypothetical protein
MEAAARTVEQSNATFCVVATRGRRRIVYATFQTYSGASLAAEGVRERSAAARVSRAKMTDVRIVLLGTPEFRRADYNMTAAELAQAIAAPAVERSVNLVTGAVTYTQR